MNSVKKYFEQELQKLHDEGRYRVFHHFDRNAPDFPTIFVPHLNKNVISWCSNDYLGMSQHPKVLSAAKNTIDTQGIGAGGTRNIAGSTIFHEKLESTLALLHEKSAALSFNSGYMANFATLSALGKIFGQCSFFSDAKNHASMIEGIRYSGMNKHIFKHNDVNDLYRLLSDHRHQYGTNSVNTDPTSTILPINAHKTNIPVIVCESVYSMDGDFAPLDEFCQLARDFNAFLYVDEVHAVGMYGEFGGGLSQQLGLSKDIDIIQGTLAKAFGCIGGYIAADTVIIDAIRSVGAGFIFSTALPPVICAAASTAIEHLMENRDAVYKQRENVHYVKGLLRAHHIDFMDTPSHIIPIKIGGGAARTKQICDDLLENHRIYVQPINYPTVPRGNEMIRITPGPLHTKNMIHDLVRGLSKVLDKNQDNDGNNHALKGECT